MFSLGLDLILMGDFLLRLLLAFQQQRLLSAYKDIDTVLGSGSEKRKCVQ